VIIISNQRTDKNNHSDVDGIGALRLSIPKDICRRIMSVCEFDWVFENNENIELFAKLNPQYDERYRSDVSLMPDIIINKDGGIFDLKQMKFVGVNRC